MSTMNETLTGQDWLDRHGISFAWSATGYHVSHEGWEHQRFTLTLTKGSVVTHVPWRQGMGIESEPSPENTLPAVRSDVEYGAMTWPEFADEFGHDEHDAPLSEYRTWEACRDMRDQLRNAFPGAFDDFLRIEEAGTE